MEIQDIKRAVERHLNNLSPSVSIAFEGMDFKPNPSAMYQRCQLIINTPDDPVFGTGYHRENATFQVFVCDVLGAGTGNALARAELIRDRFKKGTSLIENTTRIFVLRTPQIAGTLVTADRIVVPVLIPLTAEVYSA